MGGEKTMEDKLPKLVINHLLQRHPAASCPHVVESLRFPTHKFFLKFSIFSSLVAVRSYSQLLEVPLLLYFTILHSGYGFICF